MRTIKMRAKSGWLLWDTSDVASLSICLCNCWTLARRPP